MGMVRGLLPIKLGGTKTRKGLYELQSGILDPTETFHGRIGMLQLVNIEMLYVRTGKVDHCVMDTPKVEKKCFNGFTQ